MDDHLTTRAASEEYGLSDSHIRRLLGEGKLIGKKIGHYWLVNRESLKVYLSDGEEPEQIETDEQHSDSSQSSMSTSDLPAADDYGFPD